jgi:hypothetical protein
MAGIPKLKITGQRPTVFQARRLLIRKGISLPPMSVLPGRQTHAGITHLNAAIDHGKQGHADVATGHAEEALTHLEAATK